MPLFQVFLLGTPRFIYGEEALALQRRKGVALLAYLAVTGQPHSRDALATLLWPESDQSTARANLRRDLSRLQRDIGEGVLVVERDQITFARNEEVWIDVVAFEGNLATADAHHHEPGNLCARCRAALTSAIELYAGHFMAGFSLPDSPDFDEWQYFHNERLQRAFGSALQKLSLDCAVLGRYEEALTLAQRWLALDPLHEPAQRQLLSIYAWAGEWGAAMRQYEDAVELFQRELGIEPDAATRALYQSIRSRHAPPLPASAARATTTTVIAPPIIGDAQQLPVPFVGREREYDQLYKALSRAKQGQGNTVFVEGEPGIGKSRLVAEVMRTAQDEAMHVLAGKCYQGEEAMPYQVIIDLLDQIIGGWADILNDVPGPSLAELMLLTPELGERFPQLSPPSPALEEARQARIFRALHQVLRQLAGTRGLILLIDDIHWADQVTRLFLKHLAHQIASEPILLVLTCRSEEIAADERLGEYVQALLQQRHVQQLVLRRLSAEESQILISHLPITASEPGELARWLHEESDGNPFFLLTILQALKEQGILEAVSPGKWRLDTHGLKRAYAALALPEALRECVRSRLRHVPRDERAVLEVAAVFGRRFAFRTLQAMTQEQELVLLDRLEDLLRRQLLTEDEDGRYYDFSHDKIREVVYHELSTTRRELLHRQIGFTLEGVAVESVRESTALMATHFEQGRVYDRALAHLRTAAARARELFALGEAIAFYDRALQLACDHFASNEDGLLEQLYEARGEARALAGDFEGAVADLQAALEGVSATQDKVRERIILTQLGMTYRRADDYDGAKQYLDRALALARQEDDAHSLADTLFHLGTVVWTEGENQQAIPYQKEAFELSEAHQFADLVAIQAYHGHAETFFMSGWFDQAKALFERSLSLAVEAGDRSYEAENHYMLGAVHSQLIGADYEMARQHLEKALQICRAGQMDWHLVPTLFVLGNVHASLGNYYQGIEKTREAAQLAERLSFVYFKSIAQDFLGVLYRHLNLVEEAEALHAQGVEEVRVARAGNWQPRIEANLAIDRIRLGDLSVGPALHQALEATLRRSQELHAPPCLGGLAELALAQEDPNQALAYAEQLLSLAQPRGMREQVVRAHYWRGRALLARHDLDAATAALQTALQQANQLKSIRLRWIVEQAMVELRQHQGLEAEAARHQRSVKEIIRQIASALSAPGLLTGLPSEI